MGKKDDESRAPALNLKLIGFVSFAFILILILVFVFPVFNHPKDLVGEAVSTPGCYLELGSTSYYISSSWELCKNLFIASYFIDNNDNTFNYKKKDFYLLLYTMGYNQFSESQITGNTILLFYYSGGSYDYFSSVSTMFSSIRCKSLNYFGVNLYCFNRITGTNTKPNNLKYIIRDLTFLKYTNGQTWNPLTNQNVYPYNFLVNTADTLYDGSYPSFYSLSYDSIKCDAPGSGLNNYGPANSQHPINRIYICYEMLDPSCNKLTEAGLIYHEANHAYGNLSHNPGGAPHIQCSQDCPIKPSADFDFVSVYGAHINYLKKVSEINLLTNQQRCDAYAAAMQELDNKLCHCPNIPGLGITVPPGCNPYTPKTFTCTSSCTSKSGASTLD